MDQLPAVTYTRGGNARETVTNALAGHPVRVRGKTSVYTLCHVLDRLPENRTHKLIMRRMGGDEWTVWIVPTAFVTGCN